MSSDTLVQKRLMAGTTFRLQEDSVAVRDKSLFTEKKFVVLFESLPRDPVEVTFRSGGWRRLLYVFVVILGCVVIGTNNDLLSKDVFWFWMTLTVACTIRYATSRRTFFVFQSGNPLLVFEKDRPTAAEFESFLRLLEERRLAFLRTRVLDAPGITPAAEIHKLAWLKQQGAISDTEFEALKRAVVEGVPDSPDPGPEIVH